MAEKDSQVEPSVDAATADAARDTAQALGSDITSVTAPAAELPVAADSVAIDDGAPTPADCMRSLPERSLLG